MMYWVHISYMIPDFCVIQKQESIFFSLSFQFLGQQISEELIPDLNRISENSDPTELGRLLQLILGCAVNCERKQGTRYLNMFSRLPQWGVLRWKICIKFSFLCIKKSVCVLCLFSKWSSLKCTKSMGNVYRLFMLVQVHTKTQNLLFKCKSSTLN